MLKGAIPGNVGSYLHFMFEMVTFHYQVDQIFPQNKSYTCCVLFANRSILMPNTTKHCNLSCDGLFANRIILMPNTLSMKEHRYRLANAWVI